MAQNTTKSGRSGGDGRGSAHTRRQRKRWLLGMIRDPRLGYAPFGGDAETVPCVHCGERLTFETLEADRIIPGSKGGTYARENVQPACRFCNASRADDRVGFVARQAA